MNYKCKAGLGACPQGGRLCQRGCVKMQKAQQLGGGDIRKGVRQLGRMEAMQNMKGKMPRRRGMR